MKKLLFALSALASLTFLPHLSTGQVVPPTLGAAAGYTLFTAVGAFSNVGPSRVQGDIGTNAGAFSGFAAGQGVLTSGSIHVEDQSSTAAATAVNEAYTEAAGIANATTIIVNGSVPTPTLAPGAYVVGEATTLVGNLVLDAGGDPNAVFFIRITGEFTTAGGSTVTLAGGALASNVYWQVVGRLNLGQNSIMQGTLLVDGAINLFSGATLRGRALSRAGAISMDTNTINVSSSPLPVTLVSFKVAKQYNEALLQWTTASELNSKSFRVERSSTGTTNWQTVAEVTAAGTSTLPKQYSAVDTRVTPGVNYYRLRSLDLDHSYTYSQVRAITFGMAASQNAAAFPNPAANRLTVLGAGPGSQLTLTDVAGRTHLKQLASATGVDLLETSALPTGVYMLHLVSDQGQKSTIKVNKE